MRSFRETTMCAHLSRKLYAPFKVCTHVLYADVRELADGKLQSILRAKARLDAVIKKVNSTQ